MYPTSQLSTKVYGTLVDKCCKEYKDMSVLTVCLPSFRAMLKGNMLVSITKNCYNLLLTPAGVAFWIVDIY